MTRQAAEQQVTVARRHGGVGLQPPDSFQQRASRGGTVQARAAVDVARSLKLDGPQLVRDLGWTTGCGGIMEGGVVVLTRPSEARGCRPGLHHLCWHDRSRDLLGL